MDDHSKGTLETPEGLILIRRHLPLFLHDVHDYIIEGLGTDILSGNTVISTLIYDNGFMWGGARIVH